MAATNCSLPYMYKHIKRAIRARLGREWKSGDRLPPVAEVARLLGSGYTNTHRALKELAEDGYLVSRPRAGTYVTDLVASLHGQIEPAAPVDATMHPAIRGKTVRLFSVGDYEPFVLAAVDAVARALEESQAHWRSELYNPSHPERVITLHADADALLFVNPRADCPVRSAPNQLLSVVSSSQLYGVAMDSGYDVVKVDDDQGGFVAGRHMRRIDVDDVAFIGVFDANNQPAYDITSAARLRGFIRGHEKPIPAECCIRTRAYTIECGAIAFAEYMKLTPRPRGVFCATDELAIGFVHGGQAHGLAPLRDFHLIGFDGQSRGRQLATGPLTTIAAPMAQMGLLAAQLLAQRFADPTRPPQCVMLGAQLFPGQTAGRVSSP